MTLSPADYAAHDALGLAALVAGRQVSAQELALAARAAIDAVNPSLNAVVETYADRIEGLDERTLGDGPFRGVPFLIKDFFGHEAGRTIEFGSRLCRGMVSQQNTYLYEMFRAAGLNVLGRSAAPEYSMAGTTENALYGRTSTPWKHGYSSGGSTGGGMAAVAAGIVPIAHGSDIAGSIRIPASFCGGVGLKPSRGRVSLGPLQDENGYGLGQNFVQTRTVRDAAAMLDCLAIPQVGDPFLIPKPQESYAALTRQRCPPLRIGWSARPLMEFPVDREVAQAVERTAAELGAMGHHIVEDGPEFDGLQTMRHMIDVWFFGFDQRLEGYAARSGRAIGPDTLEPITFKIYQYAKTMKPAAFLTALAGMNTARRQLARFFTRHDVWLCPTTSQVAEPWGTYDLGREDVAVDELAEQIYRGTCQFTLPHNVLGVPAISLPLAMHSNGLPIGVQLAATHANDHIVLQLAAALEQAMPWAGRVPPLHASTASSASRPAAPVVPARR